MMRRLNLVFLAILIAGLAILGGGLHLVHGLQIRRNASALKDRALRAEAGRDPAKAEETWGHYLSLRPDDGEAWARYARLVDREGVDRRRLERSYLISRQALPHNPDDRALKRRCAELAMELGRPGDAVELLDELSKGLPEDAGAAEKAELADL